MWSRNIDKSRPRLVPRVSAPPPVLNVGNLNHCDAYRLKCIDYCFYYFRKNSGILVVGSSCSNPAELQHSFLLHFLFAKEKTFSKEFKKEPRSDLYPQPSITHIYVYIFTHIYVYIHTHMYKYLYTHIHIYIQTYVYTYKYIYIYIHYICIYNICIHTYICIYIYICTYMYIHVCIHTCIYI